MRRVAKVDENQKRIVTALRAVGIYVHVTSDVGGGFPDLIAANPRTGKTFLLEVKNPNKKWKLTDAQKKFWSEWPIPNLHIVQSIEDALNIVKL